MKGKLIPVINIILSLANGIFYLTGGGTFNFIAFIFCGLVGVVGLALRIRS